jgi:exonuclease SbcD
MQQQLAPCLPSVLTTHLYVAGAAARGLFRLSEQEDVTFTQESLASGWAYVALGHIHQPQTIAGMEHVRYSGSIERLDQGEREDHKSAVLVEIGPHGLTGQPILLPLEATTFYDIHITDPQTELSRLLGQYPKAETALARLNIVYRPGEDNIAEILSALERMFPRYYSRTYRAHRPEENADGDCPVALNDNDPDSSPTLSQPGATMLRYLEHTLRQDDPDRTELLALAQELLEHSTTE